MQPVTDLHLPERIGDYTSADTKMNTRPACPPAIECSRLNLRRLCDTPLALHNSVFNITTAQPLQ